MSSPSPNDLTRQQLDELDTLLQRMLGLPLAPPPDGGSPPRRSPEPPPLPEPAVRAPAGWRADAPVTVVRPPLRTADASVSLAPAADPEPVARFAPEPVRPFTPPTADTGVPPSTGDWLGRGPMVAPGTLRGVDAPALPSGFAERAGGDEPPQESEAELEMLVAELAESPVPFSGPSLLPVAVWPLAAVNWALETALGVCGPVGAALTRPAGKNALAAVGGLLLVAAAAWTARGLGWVHFPLPR